MPTETSQQSSGQAESARALQSPGCQRRQGVDGSLLNLWSLDDCSQRRTAVSVLDGGSRGWHRGPCRPAVLMASGVDQGWATGTQVRKDSHLMKETVSLEGGGLPATYMEQGSKAVVQGSQVSGSSQPLGGSRGVASKHFLDKS